MGEKNKSGQRALRVLLCAAPFMMGLYYELLCAVFALALLVWLAVYGRRHGLTLRRNMALTAVAVLFAAYVVTPLWAADHGLAVWGIAKILPLPLLAVCLMQLDGVQRRALLDDLPLTGCAMTVLSCVMQLVPPLAPYVTVNGRLAGLFQYPNTFACFLLLGLEVLIFRENTSAWKRIVQTALLTLGILLADPRTAPVVQHALRAETAAMTNGGGDGLMPPEVGVHAGSDAAQHHSHGQGRQNQGYHAPSYGHEGVQKVYRGVRTHSREQRWNKQRRRHIRHDGKRGLSQNTAPEHTYDDGRCRGRGAKYADKSALSHHTIYG